MSHEMLRIAMEMETQGNLQGANFVREAEMIGRKAQVLQESLGMTLIAPKRSEELWIPGINLEPDPLISHPLFDYVSFIRTIIIKGDPHDQLTPKENDFFLLLAVNPNVVVPPSVVKNVIWPDEDANVQSAAKGIVSSIRKKLPFGRADNHLVIKTKHGRGWMYSDPSKISIENDTAFNPEPREEVVFNHRLFKFFPERFEIRINSMDGEETTVPLTLLETQVLDILVKHRGRLALKDYFYDLETRGSEFDVQHLKTHISHLRTKIRGDRDIEEDFLTSFQDRGYMLKE